MKPHPIQPGDLRFHALADDAIPYDYAAPFRAEEARLARVALSVLPHVAQPLIITGKAA